MTYLGLYTQVRTGQMDFHQFMAHLNDLYEKAYLKGKADGLKEADEYIQGVIA